MRGVYIFDLDAVTVTESLIQAIGKDLEIEDNFTGTIGGLVRFLRDKEVLLVFDNFDYLILEGAMMLNQLLKSCPRLKIVVTSREGLDLPGEAIFQLKPLNCNLPEPESGQVGEMPGLSDSGRLFVERVRAIQADFAITPQSVTVINEICRKLDGLPLAIELAASFTEVLTVVQLSERLTDPFHLLKRN